MKIPPPQGGRYFKIFPGRTVRKDVYIIKISAACPSDGKGEHAKCYSCRPMAQRYLLWATGADRPGIVAAVTAVLYRTGCNLEDSSMMRLGGEFGIMVIFSAPARKPIGRFKEAFQSVARRFRLALDLKPLTTKEARFRPAGRHLAMVTVQGPDHPGIVHGVCAVLADHRFNITDLSSHRTTRGPRAGFILLVEGEVPGPATFGRLERALARRQKDLRAKITLRRVSPATL